MTLGPALSTPTVTIASTTPYVRLRAVLSRQAEYDRFFNAQFTQSGTTSRTVAIEATAAYVGTGAFDVTIPDFAAAQYDASWGLRTGTPVTWALGAYGWSAGAGVATPQAGVTTRNANKAGQITP